MILSKLTLTNFKKYREFTHSFEEGLIGIIGRNGAGKSTIFDAVFYALYGDIKGEKSNIKNSRASDKEAVVVDLEFEVEGSGYRVVRELRGKSLTASANLYREAEQIASQAKGVSSEITRIIGMSKDAFEHTVFASQKELTALSNLKNEDRKKIIRKLLGLEKIDKIEQELRAHLTDINRELKGFKEALLKEDEIKNIVEQKEQNQKLHEEKSKELTTTQNELKSISEKLAALATELATQQKLKDENQKLLKEQELLAQRHANEQKNLHEKNTKLTELNTIEQEYNQNSHILATYERVLQELKTHQETKLAFVHKEGLIKERNAQREQYKAVEQEINELTKKCTPKASLTKQLEDKTKFHEDSTKTLKALETQEQKLRDEIASNRSTVEKTQKQVSQLQSLGSVSACPVCTRPLLEEYESVISSLTSTIEEINTKALKELHQKLETLLKSKETTTQTKENLTKEMAALNTSLQLINEHERNLHEKQNYLAQLVTNGKANTNAIEKIGDIKYDEAKHQELEAQKSTLEPQKLKLQSQKTLIDTKPTLLKEIESTTLSIADIAKQSEQKAKEIAEHSYKANLHEDMQQAQTQATKLKDEISSKQLAQTKELESIAGDIKSLTQKLEHNANKLKELDSKEQDRKDYKKLGEFMGEFKNKINGKISPRISAIASEMYSTITKGRYQHIEVSDEFDFFIYDDGKRYPIERFSGGEVDLANLVLRIAISKTLSELSGSGGVGFLAFDEVFGSQDDERRMEIMEAFHTIKEQYRQIFLISHESEIKEMFERVVEV